MRLIINFKKDETRDIAKEYLEKRKVETSINSFGGLVIQVKNVSYYKGLFSIEIDTMISIFVNVDDVTEIEVS